MAGGPRAPFRRNGPVLSLGVVLAALPMFLGGGEVVSDTEASVVAPPVVREAGAHNDASHPVPSDPPRTEGVLVHVDGSLPRPPDPRTLFAQPPPSGPVDIPRTPLRAYQQAAAMLREQQPGCHLGWELIAGIGRIESNHARGGYVDATGDTLEPIRGPVLDGSGSVAAIPDTDNGRLDGNTRWDRAVGPMQFLPSTWQRYGADATGNGVADPDNIYDAALAAARYLCAGDVDLAVPRQLRAAVFRYNHSTRYVSEVLAWAEAYRTGVKPVPDSDVPLSVPVPVVHTAMRPIDVAPDSANGAERDDSAGEQRDARRSLAPAESGNEPSRSSTSSTSRTSTSRKSGTPGAAETTVPSTTVVVTTTGTAPTTTPTESTVPSGSDPECSTEETPETTTKTPIPTSTPAPGTTTASPSSTVEPTTGLPSTTPEVNRTPTGSPSPSPSGTPSSTTPTSVVTSTVTPSSPATPTCGSAEPSG